MKRAAAAAQEELLDDEEELLEEDEEEYDEDLPPIASQGTVKNNQLNEKKLERIKADIERRGIVYVSRVPPFMKPARMKQLLGMHGEVGRIYLAPEDTAARARRKRGGGNTGKKFTEGWVEFLDKKHAKRTAAALNGQAIGGPKRSAFHYDLWNLKYLPKLKWDHLTEEISYQKAVKEQQMALELSAAKRERDFYLRQVDQGKAFAAMTERRAKRAMESGAEASPAATGGAAGGAGGGGGGAGPSSAREAEKGGESRGARGGEKGPRGGGRSFQQRPVRDGVGAALPAGLVGGIFASARQAGPGGGGGGGQLDAAGGAASPLRPGKRQRAQ